jgi:hypothetical protein
MRAGLCLFDLSLHDSPPFELDEDKFGKLLRVGALTSTIHWQQWNSAETNA